MAKPSFRPTITTIWPREFFRRPSSMAASAAVPARPSSLPSLIEIFQIRRRLVLLDRHQHPVRAPEIHFLADKDMRVALAAAVLGPNHVLDAAVVLDGRPWPRQGIIHRGHFVVKQVRIGSIEIEALLDHALVVACGRHAALVPGAGPPQETGLDFERVVTAAPLGIDPVADGITREG